MPCEGAPRSIPAHVWCTSTTHDTMSNYPKANGLARISESRTWKTNLRTSFFEAWWGRSSVERDDTAAIIDLIGLETGAADEFFAIRVCDELVEVFDEPDGTEVHGSTQLRLEAWESFGLICVVVAHLLSI